MPPGLRFKAFPCFRYRVSDFHRKGHTGAYRGIQGHFELEILEPKYQEKIYVHQKCNFGEFTVTNLKSRKRPIYAGFRLFVCRMYAGCIQNMHKKAYYPHNYSCFGMKLELKNPPPGFEFPGIGNYTPGIGNYT